VLAVIALLLLTGLLPSCAAIEPSSAGRPLGLAGDPAAEAREVAVRARDARVIYLGEVHDNAAHHAQQRRILEALLAEGVRPVVAFEMLAEEQQRALDAAMAARADAAEMERRLGWKDRGWPDFALYWPLIALAQQHDLPVLAADLDPTLARRIAREGLAAAGSRREALVSRLPPDPEREAAIARRIKRGHCDLLPDRVLPTMVESWHARNVTMAERLASALDQGRPVVMIAGSGHQEAGGLPEQLAAIRPGTRQFVLTMLEVEPGEDPAEVARTGTGDAVWLAPAARRPDQCEELRRHFEKRKAPPAAGDQRAGVRSRSTAEIRR
jgi:uncharacterized iron-regulated protein